MTSSDCFQNFSNERIAWSPQRIEDLKEILRAQHIEGIFVPHGDVHGNEMLPLDNDHLLWLTHFSGSAGFCLLLTNAPKVALFVDGRYTLQAKQEVDTSLFDILPLSYTNLAKWLSRHNLPPQACLGYDASLLTSIDYHRLSKHLELIATLSPITPNPIATLRRRDQEQLTPSRGIFEYPLTYAGVSREQKLKDFCASLEGDFCALTNLSSIAWLLNLRGDDIPSTPTFFSFAIIFRNQDIYLFTKPRAIDQDLLTHLEANISLTLFNYDEFFSCFESLCQQKKRPQFDPQNTPYTLSLMCNNYNIVPLEKEDPCSLPRALKNKTEQEGARAAHIEDGIALCRFFYWLSRELKKGSKIDEIQVCQRLEFFRAQSPLFHSPSFDTIAGAGEHGAIVHYHTTHASNARLACPSLLLLDSGGQYLGGTTDVTRTIFIGRTKEHAPSHAQKDAFTRVLKGHIRLARARFPQGINGAHLDALARFDVWQNLEDYAHGTGHGVGNFLGVHEDPASISRASHVPLYADMILSNEPGLYKEGQWGIRIESLILLKKSSKNPAFLECETLTLSPIDRRLILIEHLDFEEKIWLNTYHKRVFDTLSPHLDEKEMSWLKKATRLL